MGAVAISCLPGLLTNPGAYTEFDDKNRNNDRGAEAQLSIDFNYITRNSHRYSSTFLLVAQDVTSIPRILNNVKYDFEISLSASVSDPENKEKAGALWGSITVLMLRRHAITLYQIMGTMLVSGIVSASIFLARLHQSSCATLQWLQCRPAVFQPSFLLMIQ